MENRAMPLYISIGIEFFKGIVRFLCHSTASYISDRSNAEITQSTLTFTAVTQNHVDSRKSQHTTSKSHDDRYYRRYRQYRSTHLYILCNLSQ